MNKLNDPTYFCSEHRVRFVANRTTRIACPWDGHTVAEDFPGTVWWAYCCDCNTTWRVTADELLLSRKKCLVCERNIARRYLCHGCQVISLASDAGGAAQYSIHPQRSIQPACPGCGTPPDERLTRHECQPGAPSFVSGRSICPACQTKLSVDEKEPTQRRFCKFCGAPLRVENRFCKNCGKLNLPHEMPRPNQTKDPLALFTAVPAATKSAETIENERRAEIEAAREAEEQRRKAAAAEAERRAELQRLKAEEENRRRREAEVLRLAEEQQRKKAEETRQQLERQNAAKKKLAQSAAAAPADTSFSKRATNVDPARTVAEFKVRSDIPITVVPKHETATTSFSDLEHKPTPQLADTSPAKEETDDVGPSFMLPANEGWLAKATSWKTVSVVVLFLIAIGFAGVTLFGRKKAANVVPTPAPAQPVAPTGMVYVPGGEFLMGNADGDDYEKPAHPVAVEPFFIDAYEVTCDAYEQFVKATGYKAPKGWTNGTFPAGSERKPVTGVDWYDASAYAQWAGKRLPTEEEWEFTARSGTGSRYPWGNEWKAGAANANGAVKDSAEVGRYSGQTSFGTFDMVGNVWEWTATALHAYPGGAIAEDKLPLDQREAMKVIRGGCYLSDMQQATSTYRRGWQGSGSAGGYDQTGFRCARDVSK